MITSTRLGHRGPFVRNASSSWIPYPESTLNWLALGLLLAAWNAADRELPTAPRPHALKGYEQVSVRAAQRAAASTLRNLRTISEERE